MFLIVTLTDWMEVYFLSVIIIGIKFQLVKLLNNFLFNVEQIYSKLQYKRQFGMGNT